jgi:hypothetical protein
VVYGRVDGLDAATFAGTLRAGFATSPRGGKGLIAH